MKAIEQYRSDIDGLRAIAVLSVIVNHLYSAVLPGGYLGVDIFFVISGYVITASLERTRDIPLGRSLLLFYSRRIKRLLPALVTMVLIGGTLIRFVDPDPAVSAITAISSLFGLSNIFLFIEAKNYFAASTQLNPFSHTWSLGVEEQFYLLFPLLLRWRAPHAGASPAADRFRLVGLGILTGASLLLFMASYYRNLEAAYFLMPFRFWELGIGCLLALLSKYSRAERPFQANAALSFLPMALALTFADRYPVLCTIAAVLSTALAIGSVQTGTRAYRVLSNGPMSYLGKISYSLYLWHWIVLCLSRWTIGIHPWSAPFQLGAIFLLSAASYHLVERPLRQGKWFGGPGVVIATGLSAACIASLLIFGEGRYAIPAFSGDRNEETAYKSPTPGYVTKFSKRKLDDCFGADLLGASLQSKLTRCTANAKAGPNLIFVGDSHATDLLPMADVIYHDGEASVTNVFQTGCRTPRLESEESACDYVEPILKLQARGRHAANILVIRNNYAPRAIDGTLKSFSQRLEQLLDRASALGFKTIYIAPSPKYYSIGPGSLCSRQWYRPDWALDEKCRNGFPEDRAEQLARRRDTTNALIALSRQRKDFLVFDPFEYLCGTSAGRGLCSPLHNGRLIYRDNSHLTEEGSELLARPFEEFLKRHGLSR